MQTATTTPYHFTENSDFSNTLSKKTAIFADIEDMAPTPFEGWSRNAPAQCPLFFRPLFCIALIICFAVPCFAQQMGIENNKWFTAEILKTTLYAKTDDEKRFCEYVIQKRDDGTIPLRILYGVYKKSMTQDRGRRFAYFKAGLELMCKQEGIVLYPTPTRSSSPTSSFIPRIPSFFRGL